MRLRFLGSGNARSVALGNSSAVLEIAAEEQLVIDFGPSSLPAYQSYYGARLPTAIYITHCHLDHIGGLEALFYAAIDHPALVKLYVPAPIVTTLHQRLANLENSLAEGGRNFWDHFQLVPVSEQFWHAGFKFRLFEARHHAPGFCFGMSLPGKFLFTGDTKPIPEIVTHYASQGELIFHDLSLQTQPSHSYLDEVRKAYSADQLARMHFYHLHDECCLEQLQEQAFSAVAPGDCFLLERKARVSQSRIVRLPCAAR